MAFAAPALIAPVIGGTLGASGPIAGAVAGAATSAGAGISASTLLGIGSLAFKAIGALTGAAGQAQQARFAAAQARDQQALFNYRAEIARQQALDVRQRAEFEKGVEASRTRQRIGKAIVAAAALGQEVGTGGSIDDILSDIGRFGRLDQITIGRNAAIEAEGLIQDATFLTARGSLARAQGAAAERFGLFGAASTLITGAGSVAQKWFGFRRERIV